MQSLTTPTKTKQIQSKSLDKDRPSTPPESPCETVVSVSSRFGDASPAAQDTRRRDMPKHRQSLEEMDISIIDTDVAVEFVGLNYIWITCLGLAGFLDLMACLLPPFIYSLREGEIEDEEAIESWNFIEYEDLPLLFLDCVEFLDKYTVTISFVFSAFWFIDTFWEAQAHRQRILQEEEKRFYLTKGEAAPTQWWKTASFVYYRIIAIQLLLLPVGFYMLLYHTLNRAVHGEQWADINDMEESITIEVTNEDYEVQYETFTTKSKRSLLFAIGQHLLLRLSGHTQRAIQSQVEALIKAIRPQAIKTLFGAIRNPLKFKRRVGDLLTALRWIKYLAPLIGAINKLKGNVEDMVKKWRQRHIAEKQKKIRQLLWGKQDVQVREEEAAIMIQSAFRAYRMRKASTALMAFRGDQRYLAALKLQRGFRRALQRAQERLRLKHEEFQRLAQMKLKDSKKLSHDEKQQFYELQDEFAQDANDLINHKLLLRPNTRFSVIWKILFVFCVTIEISQLLAKPWLDSYKANRKAEPMSMTEFVALSFVPTRASSQVECGFREEKKGIYIGKLFKRKKDDEDEFDETEMPFYCYEPAATVQEAYSDFFSLLLVPAPLADWPDCQAPKPPPRWKKAQPLAEPQRWFCAEPYRGIHKGYRRVFDFFLEEFLILVSLVCFLDVFVTFFTGELDDATGMLVPKPFVTRWILPGLLLQLAVNPNVEQVGDAIFYTWGRIIKLGPVRVYRWTEAVVYPMIYYSWIWFINYLWIPLVRHQNELEIIITNLV